MISGIIDVHAHILPGGGTMGAKTMDETRRMLQLAYDQGVRGIIATPHYLFGGGFPVCGRASRGVGPGAERGLVH